jgi:hypothetical protein
MTSVKLLVDFVLAKLPEELWNNLPPQFFVGVDRGNRRKVALVFEGVC